MIYKIDKVISITVYTKSVFLKTSRDRPYAYYVTGGLGHQGISPLLVIEASTGSLLPIIAALVVLLKPAFNYFLTMA